LKIKEDDDVLRGAGGIIKGGKAVAHTVILVALMDGLYFNRNEESPKEVTLHEWTTLSESINALFLVDSTNG
jgi:hypothetical protein